MEVYRIAKTSYSTDLTGLGARLYGARWNRKGTPMIYTSKSRALAALEYFVHLPLSLVPPDLKIVSLQIPDKTALEEISLSDLPADWRTHPAPPQLAEFGSAWVKTNKTLLLRVPSVIIEKEFNILINPGHPDIKLVTIGIIEDFKFDDRLVRQKKK
jgi:RES domain-containing protein